MTATNHRPTNHRPTNNGPTNNVPSTPETPHANDELLTLPEVAALLRVPVATLRYWRHLGSGPQSFRLGRTVRYWRNDVHHWLEAQSRRPHARH